MTSEQSGSRLALPASLVGVWLAPILVSAGLWFTAETTHQRIVLGGIVAVAALLAGGALRSIDIRRMPWPKEPKGWDGSAFRRQLVITIGGYILMTASRYWVMAGSGNGFHWVGFAAMLAGIGLWLSLLISWGSWQRRRRREQTQPGPE